MTVYRKNGLGSVRALTNGSGTLVQTYQTDAFGNVTPTQRTVTQPFGYTGQQTGGNGLVDLRTRYYDPVVSTVSIRAVRCILWAGHGMARR